MADIIEIAREGTLKTQIMYRANLSFTQLNNYLSLLISKNLLTPMIYDCREGYVATEQGVVFLQKHSELVQLLETRGGSVKKTAPPIQSLPRKA
jgi:predicted transcriptional regulator